jgi:hypothetical protein
MIDLKETIAGAEAILEKLWESKERWAGDVEAAYAAAYGYLRQGVTVYLEEQIVREPCPNHNLVLLAPGEFCAVCANST